MSLYKSKNKKTLKSNPLLLLTILIIGIIYGIFMHEFEIFPYKQIRSSFHSIVGTKSINIGPITKEQTGYYDLWSIGIYEGSSPFNLSPAKEVKNPIISMNSVSDIDASYVADPFMVIDNEEYFIFFEAFNWETRQGDIGYASSSNGVNWQYKNVILDEPFHLSYPYVFQWKDEYYMIPESNEDLSVRLYKAETFPEKWQYLGNLLSGYHFIDPSIIYYKNMWWLFVATAPDDGVINLYYSNDLLGEWKMHPMNPIIKLDKHFGRPGGRMLIYKDKLYRMAQDSYIEYGLQVFAFEITELSDKVYSEEIVSTSPVISRTGVGWNAAGMHHLDLHKLEDRWIGVADGKKYSENNKTSKHPKSH